MRNTNDIERNGRYEREYGDLYQGVSIALASATATGILVALGTFSPVAVAAAGLAGYAHYRMQSNIDEETAKIERLASERLSEKNILENLTESERR